MIPFPNPLETDRLWLHAVHPDHATQALDVLGASWPELSRWLLWTRNGLPTLEETRLRATEDQAQWAAGTAFHYHLFEKTEGALVGRVSLFDVAWDIPKATFGYWASSVHMGNGYITEAVAALTRYAIEQAGFVRLQIDCDAHNTRSAAIAQRLGFNPEAHLHNTGRNPSGALRDTLIFAKVV